MNGTHAGIAAQYNGRVRMIVRELRGLVLVGALGCAVGARAIPVVGDGGPGPVKAQLLSAEMGALGPAIAPGGTQVVGLQITLEDKWHVYWVNAGDSGEPPKIEWTLPKGITAGPMQFPAPQRLPLANLMDFGYEYDVAFPVTISAAENVKPGPVHLDAQISWLVCEKVCVPGKAHLGIDLTVKPGAPQPAQEPLVGELGKSIKQLPVLLPPAAKFSVVGNDKEFVLTLIDGKREPGGREQDAEFYPFDHDPTDVIANAAEQKVDVLPDGVKIHVKRSPDLVALPATLHGLVRVSDAVTYEVSGAVEQGSRAQVQGIGSRAQGPGFSKGDAGTTACGAIGLAFLGGVILNLMPCVFPVLFLKGLALVQSSGHALKEQRRHGGVYTLGILVSFWAIVAVLLALRATGRQAGWGFQLQSPVFIAVLASFMFFFALSLAGQFDIGLSLTSVGGGLAQKQGYAGSFFTGVLATVVATPCTAPLMGAAIGFALAEPPMTTFAVFTALALGLALPYLLLSWNPAWVRVLPRPGAWMEVLKQFTAVPLFGTAIWLAWVYGQLYSADEGVSEVALLLGCFLVLAIAGWVLGKWPAKLPATVVAVVLIVLGLAIPLSQVKSAAVQAKSAVVSATSPVGAGADLVWVPYSQAAVGTAHAAGKPVFIDFTAAWCLSCKFNEGVVLKSADVENALRKGNVLTMKADWTKYDPEITKELESVGRSGVPTYLIYPAGAGSGADVLPELLTKDLVLAAIERDTKL
jgi:thiol:disulfide interchange protein